MSDQDMSLHEKVLGVLREAYDGPKRFDLDWQAAAIIAAIQDGADPVATLRYASKVASQGWGVEIHAPDIAEAGMQLFTYPPDAGARIAELESTFSCLRTALTGDAFSDVDLLDAVVAVQMQRDRSNREIEQLRDELAAARERLEAARKALSHVLTNYKSLLAQAEGDAEKFKAENDMYGWNFHQGKYGGAVEMHIAMTKLIAALAQTAEVKHD